MRAACLARNGTGLGGNRGVRKIRWRAIALATIAAVALACTPGLRFSAGKIRAECGVVRGTPIRGDQARCIARLAGLGPSESCKLSVAESRLDDEPAFHVRESCSGLGLYLAGADGRVIGVELGSALAARP